MPSLIRPIHLAVAAFVLGVLGLSIVVLATASTGEQPADRNALVLTATFVRSTFYTQDDGLPPEDATAQGTPGPAMPPAMPVEVIETPSPTPEPPPDTPSPATEDLTSTPQPVRSCAEIRDSGSYLSLAERDFYTTTCLSEDETQPAATQEGPVAAQLESERAYRVKAQGIASSSLTSLRRYTRDQLTTSATALIDYGGLAGGWANQMDNFAPVPPSYLSVHQRLQSALWQLAAHTRLVATGQESLDDAGYRDQLLRLLDTVDAAVSGYLQVLGLLEP